MPDGAAATAERVPVGQDAAPPVFTPPPGNPRFPHLDGLRAFAALTIVAVHLADHSTYTQRGDLLAQLAARLNIGVTVFFVLSGFLLYRPWVSAREHGRPGPRVGRYLWRRALRILPAYWVALAVFGVIGWISLEGGWWRHAFFLQIYDPDTVFGGITPAWTLCVEVTFYLTLPLWALLARRWSLRTDAIALVAIGLASLAFRWWSARTDPGGTMLLTLPTHLLWFAAGMLMAVGSVHLERAAPSRLLAPLYARPELAWALAAAGYLATALWADIPVYFNPRSPADEVVTQVCFVVISALVVLPATAPDRWRPRTGPVTALLDARVVVWLGLISYGIFLWHQPFLFKFIEEGVLDTQGAWVVGALVLVATLCAATLSYRLVEEPALRFKDVRFRRRG